MPDERPTFADTPMRPAEAPPAPAHWHVFVTFGGEEGLVQVEYLIEAKTIREAIDRGIQDVLFANVGADVGQVIEVKATRMPTVLRV